MRQRIITSIISLLFATVFLVPRIASLHAISHSSDNDEVISCEVCDIIIASNQFDLIIDDTFYFNDDSYTIPSSLIVYTQYNTPTEKIVTPISICNKPPPSI